MLKPGLVKGQWSAEEDDRLVGLVEKGFRNWGQVRTSTIAYATSGKLVAFEVYLRLLSFCFAVPSSSHTRGRAHAAFMVRRRGGFRSQPACLIRNSNLNHTNALSACTRTTPLALRRPCFAETETLFCLNSKVASFMDGRTSKQCRERWCHHLDPAVRKGGYTTEEDDLIILLQASGGGTVRGGGSSFIRPI